MRKTGLFAGLAVAGLISGGTAFGQVLLFEDNSGLDRFFTGGWSGAGSFIGWTDNIEDNGGTWLATNGQFISKAPYGQDDGDVDAPGFAGVFRGATGDTAEMVYDFVLPFDVAPHVPVLFEATYKGIVSRLPDRTTNMRTQVRNLDTATNWVTEAETLRYITNDVSVGTNADIFMDPAIWPDNTGFSQDGPELDISNGWTIGHSGTAGDAMQIRFRQAQGDSGPGSQARHIGTGIGNIQLVAATPGDATLSRTVDIDDASILLTNFGQTSGMTWTDADFTGDGAVDIDDASLLLGNFGASYSPAAGEIEVTIDIANKQVIIEANQVALIRLEDPSGNIISYDPAVPFSTVNPVTPTLVGEFMLGNFITGTAVIGFADFVNQEVIIGYQLLGQDRIDNTYVLIPEPASLALLGLGGLVLLRRRAA